MSYQIHDYGRTVAELLKNGVAASKGEVPLGAYHDGTGTRFRWAQVNDGIVRKGRAVIANSYKASAVAIPGGMLVSATERYGGQGAREVRLFSAVIASAGAVTRLVDGTFEVLSGADAPYICQLEGVEQGEAGKRTLVTLQSELPFALSTAHMVVLRPNKYYGCKLPGAIVGEAAVEKVVGITTGSTTTSGFQLIAERGVWPGYFSNAVAAGLWVGATTSGVIMSAGTGASALPNAIGRAVATGAATKFMSVDWFIDGSP